MVYVCREAVAYVVEDTRLSTLQRKLVKEGDESVALALASHVNECLLYPENGSYISRCIGGCIAVE